MTVADTLGLLAGVLTAGSAIPQAIMAWRSKSTTDLSKRTLVALATGLALWVVYGIARSDLPLIAANTVSLAITLAVLFAKVRFG